ncbi:TPA: hypothetical protein UMU63_002695 [Stenotrophomonas maltophilia]|uniref:hypothetical protein n=1 Tax=Stenotrophomonas maltophilia TaxID=40324 RepID=UPI0018D3D16A|nr:hypothetical protein [Stenotrophomonas maltophilia]MBH1877719.1 hypothetical protein [Stenotrophomonas maltophilia]MDT3447861.1 hypothetical protein [Stenotrophomonas maltophilia]HDX0802519.1 hypothetical protein [Stenotrophomonas maltophilia]HDX0816430.1 hypothetical protein [Stenotrophomonas maltophilia]HDX0825920.1 hypothetical protein [Stenotrophomonas maltophilia]
MADIDKAGGSTFVVQPPVAIVSSSPAGLRTVVVRVRPSAPILKTMETPVSSSGPQPMTDFSKFDDRLRAVELDVATIKERITHMPTTMKMWVAIATITIPVGAAVVGILSWVLQNMLEPLLKAAT